MVKRLRAPMPQLEAHADLARDGRLFIRPAAGAKLRGLERTLRAARIALEVDPVGGGALVHAADFDACRSALEGWSLAATARAEAAAETVRRRRKWHPAALAACRVVTSSPETARGWLGLASRRSRPLHL